MHLIFNLITQMTLFLLLGEIPTAEDKIPKPTVCLVSVSVELALVVLLNVAQTLFYFFVRDYFHLQINAH